MAISVPSCRFVSQGDNNREVKDYTETAPLLLILSPESSPLPLKDQRSRRKSEHSVDFGDSAVVWASGVITLHKKGSRKGRERKIGAKYSSILHVEIQLPVHLILDSVVPLSRILWLSAFRTPAWQNLKADGVWRRQASTWNSNSSTRRCVPWPLLPRAMIDWLT